MCGLIVGMPSGDNLYAKDLIEVLERKHEAKSYKRIVSNYSLFMWLHLIIEIIRET